MVAVQEPVGAIRRRYGSGSGDEDGPEFIQCADGREPHIHKVWNFGEDGVTCEVHPTGQFDRVSSTGSYKSIMLKLILKLGGKINILGTKIIL